MREKLIWASVGCITGIIITALLYSFVVSTNPQATETDKGVILAIGVLIIFAFGFGGFKYGEDP